jgi:hypothetical protein
MARVSVARKETLELPEQQTAVFAAACSPFASSVVAGEE